jgi:hypothetical protein
VLIQASTLLLQYAGDSVRFVNNRGANPCMPCARLVHDISALLAMWLICLNLVKEECSSSLFE